MKERITLTLEQAILKKIDGQVDGLKIRNRSHAVELLLAKQLEGTKIKTAFLLAGGEGTRLRPFTYELPKPLIPLHGKPIIQHVMEHLKSFGIKNMILSVGYKSEKIISHFGRGEDLGLNIEYVIEKKRLGTAGPLRLAKEHLNETFIMLNGDVLTRLNIAEMVQLHHTQNALGTIALLSVPDPSRYGVVELSGSQINGFVEKPAPGKAPSNLINAGQYILEPEVLDYLPKKEKCMMEHDVFPKLAKAGKLFGFSYAGPWFDLGTTESYEKAIKEWK